MAEFEIGIHLMTVLIFLIIGISFCITMWIIEKQIVPVIKKGANTMRTATIGLTIQLPVEVYEKLESITRQTGESKVGCIARLIKESK